jgi:uncharacterized protein YbbK (DUF523 family)
MPDAWAMLGLMLVQDYAQGYNVRADSLRQAEEAARKAVELAPSNHLGLGQPRPSAFLSKGNNRAFVTPSKERSPSTLWTVILTLLLVKC